jgi:hypothetical protein
MAIYFCNKSDAFCYGLVARKSAKSAKSRQRWQMVLHVAGRGCPEESQGEAHEMTRSYTLVQHIGPRLRSPRPHPPSPVPRRQRIAPNRRSSSRKRGHSRSRGCRDPGAKLKLALVAGLILGGSTEPASPSNCSCSQDKCPAPPGWSCALPAPGDVD